MTSSNVLNVNVYDSFINNQGKHVFSETTMEFVQIDWIAIPNSSFQWSIIEEGLVCFSSLLLFMTSVVERSMSVEFLDDTKMERAAKTLGDKVRIQNYADRLKKCSSKSRMDCH